MQDGKESILIDVPDETFADDFGASPSSATCPALLFVAVKEPQAAPDAPSPHQCKRMQYNCTKGHVVGNLLCAFLP